jgi:large subunit ribosomal protein L4
MAIHKVPHFDAQGATVGELSFDDAKLGSVIHRKTLHDVCVWYAANKRVGTASTKSKDEVSGSGKKLYRQKGTGRARAGNRQSPTRVGGAASMTAPRPRSYRVDFPRKMKIVALRSALISKFKDGEVAVVDGWPFADKPSTKAFAKLVKSIFAGRKAKKRVYGPKLQRAPEGTHKRDRKKIEPHLKRVEVEFTIPESVLISYAGDAGQLLLSSRNVDKTLVTSLDDLNALDVVKNRKLLLTKTAFDELVAGNLRPAKKKATA